MFTRLSDTALSKVGRALRILFAIIALATGLPCLIKMFTNTNLFFAGEQASLYWLVVGEQHQLFTLAAICSISAWFALMLLSNIGCYERLLISVLWIAIAGLILTLIAPSYPGFHYEHSDSINTPQHTYYVGEEMRFEGICPTIGDNCDGDYLYKPIVFQCGPFGFWCRAIFHGSELRSSTSYNLPVSTFTLDGSTIRLVVDGDVVWEQSLESGGE
jgi:hypothetical protein